VEHSHIFALPNPILREFAVEDCAFTLVEDGAWRARRALQTIREIKERFRGFLIPADVGVLCDLLDYH
jgi:hypothetical protein